MLKERLMNGSIGWKRRTVRLEHWKAQKSEFDTLSAKQSQLDYVQTWIEPHYSITRRDLPR